VLSPDAVRVRLEALADTLWAERHVVELLLYKLVAARLLLAADERRFVHLALGEVERVLAALRTAEEHRVAATEALAAVLGLPADAVTLPELAVSAPEPLRSVFADHQKGFAVLTAEIEETAATNRRLASIGLSSLEEALERISGAYQAATYTAQGRHQAAAPAAVRLDRVM
jgi:hypothetical protein